MKLPPTLPPVFQKFGPLFELLADWKPTPKVELPKGGI